MPLSVSYTRGNIVKNIAVIVLRDEIRLIQRFVVLSDQSVQLVVRIADGQTLVFVDVECLWARAIFPHSKKGRISPTFLV